MRNTVHCLATIWLALTLVVLAGCQEKPPSLSSFGCDEEDKCFDEPQSVQSALQFTSVVAGGLHSCALTTTGAAYCWGDNSLGQLGLNSDIVSFDSPQPVAGGLTFTQISAGIEHTCGVASGGVAYCWGSGSNGLLGGGAVTGSCSSGPCEQAPAPVAGSHQWLVVDAGFSHSCGVALDGAAYCWGSNLYGELGIGSRGIAYDVPQQLSGSEVYATISAGDRFSCGVTDAGGGRCWGLGESGALGTDSPSSCDISGTDVPCLIVPTSIAPTVVFSAITAGLNHSCGRRNNGAVLCWGQNLNGQLGLSTVNAVVVPVQILANPTVTNVSAGSVFSCVLSSGGSVICWGSNIAGQIGVGTVTVSVRTPQVVVGGRQYTDVSAGGLRDGGHACAIGTNGTAYCWGADDFGQVGNGPS